MPRTSFRLLFALAACTALLAGCDIKVNEGGVSLGVSRGKATDEWVRSYQVAKNGRFEIVNQNGAIDVYGGAGTEVKVKATREVSAGSDEEAQRRLKELKMREDVGADRVRIEAETGDGFEFGRGVTVHYEVEVPDGLTVNFKTMNGAVRLERVDGRITAATTNGNVSGDDVTGAVQASSVNGSVRMNLDAVNGDVRLNTVNGAIRVELDPAVNADLDAMTVNGGVSVDDRLGLANVSRNRSAFGPPTSISGRLNQGGARVSLQTTNGGVRVTVKGDRDSDDDGRERGRGLRGRRGRGAATF